jgi:hypothetical protein
MGALHLPTGCRAYFVLQAGFHLLLSNGCISCCRPVLAVVTLQAGEDSKARAVFKEFNYCSSAASGSKHACLPRRIRLYQDSMNWRSMALRWPGRMLGAHNLPNFL